MGGFILSCKPSFDKNIDMLATYELQMYTLWKNAKVPDDLITDYASFLKHRDLLPYMRFNPKVMHALVKLADSLYWSSKKINRSKLIGVLRRYWDQNQIPAANRAQLLQKKLNAGPEYRLNLLPETKTILVNLCVKILCYEPQEGQQKQIELQYSTANQLIKNMELSENQIALLLKNLHLHPHNLNRILRHPVPSPLISKWALKNFDNNRFRRRRAEMTGWLLNENPDYVVPFDVLIADFEHANEEDKQDIEKATGAYPEISTLEETFPGMFSTKPEPFKSEYEEYNDDLAMVHGANFKTRFFDRKYRWSHLGHNPVKYDFSSLIQFFYSNLETTQSVTMMWAIYYSHLPKPQKRKMLKHWYHKDAKKTFFRICEKMNDVTLLGWFLKVYQNG